jgi:Aspartyl protease
LDSGDLRERVFAWARKMPHASLLRSNYRMSCFFQTAREERPGILRVVRLALIATALSFAGLSGPLAAQQTSPGPNRQQPDQIPPSTSRQHPDNAAQLETGTPSGLSTEARLQNLLADHEYLSIEAQLGQLGPEEAQFYRGILANRSNRLAESAALLEPLVDEVTKTGSAAHEKELRTALAEDYLRLGEWKKAAEAYQELEARMKDKLTQDEQDEIEMPLKLLPLAANAPSPTVDPCDPFELQVSQDPLGLVDVPVFVDARSRHWMLDPTLPFNLIARSTAREAGLRISEAGATIKTLTGRPVAIHAAVIPRFTIGGRLTVHNMPVFVFDDKDYYFPNDGYRVEGVLGYPAMAAMGSLTVNSDGNVFVRPARQISPPASDDQLRAGARFYLDGDEVIVALGRKSNPSSHPEKGTSDTEQGNAGAGNAPGQGEERMYAVDAGGQQTYLTSRYFDEHAADFNNQKMEMFSFPGTQSAQHPAYVAQDVPLMVGSSEMTLHFIRVLAEPLGSTALDDVYGVLGADALGQLKSYTFDYRTMRFAVTTE